MILLSIKISNFQILMTQDGGRHSEKNEKSGV